MKTESKAFIRTAARLLNNMRGADTVLVCQARPHPEEEPHTSLQIVSWGNTPRALTDLAQNPDQLELPNV
jgi:hypothetical protein